MTTSASPCEIWRRHGGSTEEDLGLELGGTYMAESEKIRVARYYASLLRPGYNKLTVEVSRLAPDYQKSDFTWGDVQFRRFRLE